VAHGEKDVGRRTPTERGDGVENGCTNKKKPPLRISALVKRLREKNERVRRTVEGEQGVRGKDWGGGQVTRPNVKRSSLSPVGRKGGSYVGEKNYG